MSHFLFFAWIASILYGLETVIGKLISKHSIKNHWMLNFFWALFTLILIIPIALLNGATFPHQWLGIILGSFVFALNSILFIVSLYFLDVSVLSPLYSFRTVFAVLLGVFFLGESLTQNQWLFIFIIIIAGLFVNTDEGLKVSSFFSKKIVIALFYMFSLALVGVFTKIAINQTDYWTGTLWIMLLAQFWLIPTCYFFRNEIKNATNKQYISVFIVSALGVFGTLAAFKAYSVNLSVASAIISIPFSMIIAFLFSIFAPKLLEKHTKRVYFIRFFSAAVMIIFAFFLSK